MAQDIMNRVISIILYSPAALRGCFRAISIKPTLNIKLIWNVLLYPSPRLDLYVNCRGFKQIPFKEVPGYRWNAREYQGSSETSSNYIVLIRNAVKAIEIE